MTMLSKDKTPTTLLALALDGSRLEAVVLRRTNGSVTIQKTATATLALDLFKDEVELVGKELRDALDAAGIREKRCVACVPTAWVLSVHAGIPEMPEEDVPGFLEIEAERGFPNGMEDLRVCVSRYAAPSGARFATQLAVTREHLARLDEVLEAAGLKPHGFSPGLTALPGVLAARPNGQIAAVVGESAVDLLVTSGGGVVALRSIEGAFDTEGGDRRLQSEHVARDLRITLGQMPPEVRGGVREFKIFGASRFAEQLMIELRPRAASMGLLTEHVPNFGSEAGGLKVPDNTPVSCALALAAQYLSGRKPFEFLPPKPSLWKQFSERYSSGKLAWAGVAAGLVAASVIGLFGWQQFRLNGLNGQWSAMKKPVSELEDIQKQVRKYRPWFDESHTSLSVLQRVTESFPEDGSVAAKSFEIRNLASVSCSGTMRDSPSLLKALDRLRAVGNVSDIKVDSMKGKAPAMQFTFRFNWGTPRRNEN
ncbi:MAG: hypothetical protein FJ386_00655 [Verrucomicrobia bacterium]|nr:hypothetical protein [Verrucomicrobiota bacterium]